MSAVTIHSHFRAQENNICHYFHFWPHLFVCVVVLSLSCVRILVIPWIAAHQTSLFLSISPNLLKFMSIESVMTSSHFILYCPLRLPSSVFPRIRVFSNKSVLQIRWPKYWGFILSISRSNEYSGMISFGMDWLDLLAIQGLRRVFSNTTVQKYQFFRAQLSL